MPSPPFADAVRLWLKMGLVSFGGPAPQISILHHEVVEAKAGPLVLIRAGAALGLLRLTFTF